MFLVYQLIKAHVDLLVIRDDACMCADCVTSWERRNNTAAVNGRFYGWVSESQCMAACLTSHECVAFDISPKGCILHLDSDNLNAAYYVDGVTQFVLSRQCPTASPVSVDISATTTPSVAPVTGMLE